MKSCKYCNKTFEPVYTNKAGYSYINNAVIFCSKRCAAKDKKTVEKQQIVQDIIDYVTEKNRYCTKDEILKGVKRSSKTLTKLQISIVGIQEALGLTKPKSIFAEKVYTYLKKVCDNIECEKTFEDLRSSKGYLLRLDFYIESLNIIVEADGTQHIDENNPWYTSYLKNCDAIKDSYAKDNGICMVRIPYTKNVTDNYIEQYLADFI